MFAIINENNVVIATSEHPVKIGNNRSIKITKDVDRNALIGTKVVANYDKPACELKVAFICNYGDNCGIATYSNMLIDAIKPLVKEIKVFAEDNSHTEESAMVTKCWSRGKSMVNCIEQVLAWKPDIVHIQHEFGLFPNGTKFLKMLEMLNNIPYVITVHSVYEHLDKTVCTAYIKNMIVHSETGKNALRKLGHDTNGIYVIKHGCVEVVDNTELWNILHNDYSVIQFGFGFSYKGVDQAIDAVHYLKKSDEKFKDIFYCYLCSENPHTMNVHEEYYNYIQRKIKDLDLRENVVVLRGFLSEPLISNFMRTAKLAIFPYKNNPNNMVFGASGAVRVAMANGIAVIASDSHMFDDLDGVVPRIDSAETLASEIDKMFSDADYKKQAIKRNLDFVKNNNWNSTAIKHLEAYRSVIDNQYKNSLVI